MLTLTLEMLEWLNMYDVPSQRLEKLNNVAQIGTKRFFRNHASSFRRVRAYIHANSEDVSYYMEGWVVASGGMPLRRSWFVNKRGTAIDLYSRGADMNVPADVYFGVRVPVNVFLRERVRKTRGCIPWHAHMFDKTI